VDEGEDLAILVAQKWRCSSCARAVLEKEEGGYLYPLLKDDRWSSLGWLKLARGRKKSVTGFFWIKSPDKNPPPPSTER
jgi:hypothetical protein